MISKVAKMEYFGRISRHASRAKENAGTTARLRRPGRQQKQQLSILTVYSRTAVRFAQGRSAHQRFVYGVAHTCLKV